MEESNREIIKQKLRQYFDGRIVRKDLTKKIKEGANVPVYVLEFLLGQYCCSDDDEVIGKGVHTVKRILADNFVRPDEAQKILAKLRSNGSHTVIDMITVHLDIKKTASLQSFPTWASRMSPLQMSIPNSMTVCCAAVSGVSFSWNMNTTKRTRRTVIRSKSGNSRRSRCLMWISRN